MGDRGNLLIQGLDLIHFIAKGRSYTDSFFNMESRLWAGKSRDSDQVVSPLSLAVPGVHLGVEGSIGKNHD